MKSFQTVCCLGIISLILHIPVGAQIVPDNSVGTLLVPNTNIQGLPSDVINGGTKNGSNLFHSFQEFNVGANRGVYFNNPADVTNIFTRVTSSNASNINGTLGVLGNANLFFLNPNGIFFGSTAKLDVKGSFISTTASSINFADSTQFNVATAQPSLLTVSVPVGLGFGSNPGKINNRYTLTSGQGSAGNININTRSSVALDAVSKNGAFSTILSVVRPTGVGKAGDVNITTGSLYILDGGQIGAGSFGQGDVGRMNINVRNNITFDGAGNSTGAPTGAFSLVGVPNAQQVTANNGGININANSLTLRNGAIVTTSTLEQGSAGKVNINARESILFDGTGLNGYPSAVATTVEQQGVGNGGDIEIATKLLSLMNGALLAASSRGQGSGGSITVNANTLTAMKGGQILTNSTNSGNAGNITLNVQENLTLAGSDVNYPERLAKFGEQRVVAIGSESGIFANTSKNSQGRGGDLRIVTGKLTLSDGAIANVSSEGTGNAGNFKVKADLINLNNGSSFKAENREGSGGNITLDARNIMLRQNSNITTNATDTATGGNININADTLVALENSDITANAIKGRGGNINITTQGIFRDFDSDITATSDVGINGSVNIRKPDINQQNNLIEQ